MQTNNGIVVNLISVFLIQVEYDWHIITMKKDMRETLGIEKIKVNVPQVIRVSRIHTMLKATWQLFSEVTESIKEQVPMLILLTSLEA